RGVGTITAQQAIDLGVTGPCLRACGVAVDLRRARPYLLYPQLEFDVPVGTRGDAFDRYLVRIEEMRQSARILKQLLDALPAGRGLDREGLEERPAAEGRGLHVDGGDDPPVQDGDRVVPAEGRGLPGHRGRERRARVLPRLGRPLAPVPRQDPRSVVREPAGA